MKNLVLAGVCLTACCFNALGQSGVVKADNQLIPGATVKATQGSTALPPGFGHAIYPEGDPRAMLLKETAQTIARRKGRKLYEIALKVEQAVFKRERLRPNLDFYLTVCTRMLGFPLGSPAAIFAVGRSVGWIAHTLEQYANNRLIRPRMRYRGVPLRHWE